MIIMELTGVDHKYYNNFQVYHALKNVSISIHDGEKVAIVGHSGSGKSTLANILGCLLTPTKGSYRIWGNNTNLMSQKEMAQMRLRNFGMIFQNFNLIKRLNVIDNVVFPLIYDTFSLIEIKKMAMLSLERVGMIDYSHKMPDELSGGQQQLIAIARAIVKTPKILIADEPTASLDVENENKIMDIIDELNKAGTTLITITHNSAIAHKHFRILNVSAGNVSEEASTLDKK